MFRSLPRPRMADVVAGVSVALVLVPQSVAYASLAGMPPQIGLFASAFPLIVFSFFASSPYLQSGPTAVTSLLTFSALAGTGYLTETEDYVRAGALLALMVGVIRLALGLARLGKVTFAVAEPVMVGFTSGAAIVIFSTQISKVVGVEPPADITQPIKKAIWTFGHVGEWHILAIAIAALTLVLMLGGKRAHPLFPGVLVAVVIGVLFSLLTDYDDRFIRAVAGDPNEIPSGFPAPTFDLPWNDLTTIFIGGVVIALVGFAEPSAIARMYANQENEHWDANQELRASGLANLTSAFSGTYPVGGSFSRSSLNKLAGAQTRASGGITGVVILAFLPFAPLLNNLPNAVLGAIVIGAVISLLQPQRLARMWSRSRSQALLAYATLACTVLFAPDVYWAIAIGFCLTLVHHFLVPLRVQTVDDDGAHLELKATGLVWLASASSFERALDAAVAASSAPSILLDLSATPSVDAEMAQSIAAKSAELVGTGRVLITHNSPAGADELIAAASPGLSG